MLFKKVNMFWYLQESNQFSQQINMKYGQKLFKKVTSSPDTSI